MAAVAPRLVVFPVQFFVIAFAVVKYTSHDLRFRTNKWLPVRSFKLEQVFIVFVIRRRATVCRENGGSLVFFHYSLLGLLMWQRTCLR
jgi:hypothetical protein